MQIKDEREKARGVRALFGPSSVSLYQSSGTSPRIYGWTENRGPISLPADRDHLRKVLKGGLSSSELDNCVIYLLSPPVPTRTTVDFPGTRITTPWPAWVAFIDLDPLANYGHRCRYVLLNPDSGETRSFEARFPPFRPGAQNNWRVIYEALGLPDSVLAAPKEDSFHEEGQT